MVGKWNCVNNKYEYLQTRLLMGSAKFGSTVYGNRRVAKNEFGFIRILGKTPQMKNTWKWNWGGKTENKKKNCEQKAQSNVTKRSNGPQPVGISRAHHVHFKYVLHPSAAQKATLLELLFA
jgi:hypothetical protein